MAVVLARSYSRNSDRTSLERETSKPSSLSRRATLSSCSGRRNEKSSEIATDSTPAASSASTRGSSWSSSSDRRTRPSRSTLSSTPKHRSVGTSGSGRPAARS